MSAQPDLGEVTSPRTLPEALAAISAGGRPVAGATWILRAPLRHEPMPRHLVSLAGIEALARPEPRPGALVLGAMATHEALIATIPPGRELRALALVAERAANPGIRRIATLGGNLCAADFAASDLVPALLCLDARVALASPAGPETLPMEDFLARRRDLAGALLTHVEIPRADRRSAHERLPMRRAGDYPCAIVSLSATLVDGVIRDIRIALGAVEPVPRRWRALESALAGQRLDPAAAETAARDLAGALAARDAVDAPGWYRLSVLPALLRRALATLQAED